MKKKKKLTNKKILVSILTIFLLLWIVVAYYNSFKTQPEGIAYESPILNIPDEDIEFLYNLNYETNDEEILETQILEKAMEMIDNAEKFILIDMFIFTPDNGEIESLKNKLIQKKQQNPEMKITFITDEFNTFYESYTPNWLSEFRENNIEVIFPNLNKIRDPDPTYSGFWRTYLQWFGTGKGWIKYSDDENKKVSIRAILKSLNAKVNHRKLIVADNKEEIHSLVTSANFVDHENAYSNVALFVKSKLWEELLTSEQSLASMSDLNLDIPTFTPTEKSGEVSLQLLTENKIGDHILSEIDSTKNEDRINIATFLLSDRRLVNSLIEASERGTEIMLVLDPSKTLFGRDKKGIPNRAIAYELSEKSNGKIQTRWYDTEEEQFHSKLLIINNETDTITILGSPNFAKKSMGRSPHLETSVKVISDKKTNFSKSVNEYFERIWNNENALYTLDFDTYEKPPRSQYLFFRLKELLGIR